MADDTIQAARQAVIGAVLRYADACERDLPPSEKALALKAVEDAFDALVAAVRAETLATIAADYRQQIERLKQSEPRPPFKVPDEPDAS